MYFSFIVCKYCNIFIIYSLTLLKLLHFLSINIWASQGPERVNYKFYLVITYRPTEVEAII